MQLSSVKVGGGEMAAKRNPSHSALLWWRCLRVLAIVAVSFMAHRCALVAQGILFVCASELIISASVGCEPASGLILIISLIHQPPC